MKKTITNINTQEKNIYKKIIISGGILIIFLGLYSVFALRYFDAKNIGVLFSWIYNNLTPEEIRYILPVIMKLLPQIVLVYILGSYIYDDLRKTGIYIFTRTDGKRKWLLSKISYLFRYVVIFYSIQYMILFFIGKFFSYNISSYEIKSLLQIFMLVILESFLFILCVNILSLFIGNSQSVLILLCFNIGNILLLGFFYEFFLEKIDIAKALPFIQGIYSLHTDSVNFFEAYNIEVHKFSNFNIITSIIYLLILIIIISILGIYRIEKQDII